MRARRWHWRIQGRRQRGSHRTRVTQRAAPASQVAKITIEILLPPESHYRLGLQPSWLMDPRSPLMVETERKFLIPQREPKRSSQLALGRLIRSETPHQTYRPFEKINKVCKLTSLHMSPFSTREETQIALFFVVVRHILSDTKIH